MPTLLLEYSFTNVPIQTKLSKKHLWFDSQANEMREFHGGKLSFVWDTNEKRLKPKLKFEWNTKTRQYDVLIDDVFETSWKKSDNREAIENWVEQIGKRLGVEVNGDETSNKGVAIDVDIEDLSIVEYALDRHGIRYSEV
jgi:hypothetical protein